MPKKRTKKKSGGLSKKELSMGFINKYNMHNPTLFSTTTGAITGCTGCDNGDINIGSGCNLPTHEAASKSAERGIITLLKGMRGQVGGNGNAGVLSKKNMQQAAQQGMINRVPIQSIQNCNKKQSGGGSRKSYKKKRHPKKGQRSRTRKGRKDFVTHKGDKYYNRSHHRQTGKRGKKPYVKRRKTKKNRSKKKTLKGGYYKQFGSNCPSTPGYSSPNVGSLPWATGPVSIKRQINCQDNYNHYTGKKSSSCN